jgi:hypothetical protein
MEQKDTLAEKCRSRTPQGLALYYELIFSDMDWTFPAHLMPVGQGICDTRPSFPLVDTIKPAEIPAEWLWNCPNRGHVITL